MYLNFKIELTFNSCILITLTFNYKYRNPLNPGGRSRENRNNFSFQNENEKLLLFFRLFPPGFRALKMSVSASVENILTRSNFLFPILLALGLSTRFSILNHSNYHKFCQLWSSESLLLRFCLFLLPPYYVNTMMCCMGWSSFASLHLIVLQLSPVILFSLMRSSFCFLL